MMMLPGECQGHVDAWAWRRIATGGVAKSAERVEFIAASKRPSKQKFCSDTSINGQTADTDSPRCLDDAMPPKASLPFDVRGFHEASRANGLGSVKCIKNQACGHRPKQRKTTDQPKPCCTHPKQFQDVTKIQMRCGLWPKHDSPSRISRGVSTMFWPENRTTA